MHKQAIVKIRPNQLQQKILHLLKMSLQLKISLINHLQTKLKKLTNKKRLLMMKLNLT